MLTLPQKSNYHKLLVNSQHKFEAEYHYESKRQTPDVYTCAGDRENSTAGERRDEKADGPLIDNGQTDVSVYGWSVV